METSELSSARVLAESLGSTLQNKSYKFQGVDLYQKRMLKDVGVIAYANLEQYLEQLEFF